MKKTILLLSMLLYWIALIAQLNHLKIPSIKEGLVDVEVLNEDTYILAEKWNSKIYKTTDGGDSWTFKIVETDFPSSNESKIDVK